MNLKSNRKVSIIVAVYNSEIFLRKCIDSIIKQTYTNLEIILVDDGSPDNSGKICDDYSYNDNRIKVLHKENGGTCEARNVGLTNCTGDYIVIVDGDDWLSLDYVEYMLELAISNDADMVMTDKIFTTRDQVQSGDESISILSAEDAACMIIYPRIPIGPWSKMYRHSLLTENNISFSVSWSGEGLYFSVTAAQNANKVILGHRKVYNYRLNNSGSGLTNYNVQMGINALENIILIGNNSIIKGDKFSRAVYWHTWKNYLYLFFLIIATDTIEENKMLYYDCLKNIRKRILKVVFQSDLNCREKAHIILMGAFPKHYSYRRLKKEKISLKNDNME